MLAESIKCAKSASQLGAAKSWSAHLSMVKDNYESSVAKGKSLVMAARRCSDDQERASFLWGMAKILPEMHGDAKHSFREALGCGVDAGFHL